MMICSSALLTSTMSIVDRNRPMKLVSLDPLPSTLPGGQADGPRVSSSRSLAVQRSGTLV